MDKVRKLQRTLYTAAKQSRGRRFHALFDRICRGDVLAEAWKRVRAKRGSAGADGETLEAIEARGVDEFLRELGEEVRSGRYRPRPLRRRYIPKPDGRSERPLGIPAVRDRVVQMAAEIVLEPIFEAGFRACSFGFRPRRSATDAKEAIRLTGGRGHYWVVGANIRGFLYLFRWPSAQAMESLRARIRLLTDRRRRAGMRDIREVIEELNPLLRGWGNYFRTGNASQKFNQIDRYVSERLVRLLGSRRGRKWKRRPFRLRTWPHTRFVEDFGLYKLLGTIQYPGAAHAT